jgi:Ser/Thr protein kinase RdoA (MazF antagonist)
MENWLDLTTNNLLGRIDSRLNKQALLKDIAQRYRLGEVLSFEQIKEGFEDYNVKLVTSKGSYLVKLFSQYKSFRHVKDNVCALVKLQKAGVNIPKFLSDKKGKCLYNFEHNDVMALGCVMKYFEGKSFLSLKKEPSDELIISLTKEITEINQLNFKPKGVYDVWVVQNLETEFKKKKQFLPQNDKKLIEKAVDLVSNIDYSKYSQGFIHNDINRSNVLVNNKEEFKIIDFSVMEYSALPIELGTYLSLFCVNPLKDSIDDLDRKYDKVINTYTKFGNLTEKDVSIVKDLMFGTYAANNLAGNFEWFGKDNKEEDTKYWIELGRQGMELMN